MTAAMRGTDPTDPPKCRLAEWSTKFGCCLETNLQRVVTTSEWIASGDLFGCCLTEWSTIGSDVAQGAHLKWLRSQEQSTASWLTPISDLIQWDANFLFVFSLLCSSRKTKTKCYEVYYDGRQRVEESPTLWYQMLGNKAVRAEVQATFVMMKNLCVRISKIDIHTHTHSHTHRGTKKRYIS